MEKEILCNPRIGSITTDAVILLKTSRIIPQKTFLAKWKQFITQSMKVEILKAGSISDKSSESLVRLFIKHIFAPGRVGILVCYTSFRGEKPFSSNACDRIKDDTHRLAEKIGKAFKEISKETFLLDKGLVSDSCSISKEQVVGT